MKIFPFLLLACLLAFFACGTPQPEQKSKEAEASPQKNPPLELLVGTYTGGESKGIYALDFDPDSGALSNKRLLVETNSPSYLALSADRQFVYAVNESAPGYVSAFRWNEKRDSLLPLNQQPSGKAHPCFVELSAAGDLLALANYSSGDLSVYPIDEEGLIGERSAYVQHQGSGPVTPNQESARAHCVKFSADGRFLYAVDLGIDQLITYPLLINGALGESSSILKLDPGDGPRHLIFHPSKDMAFVINELSSTVQSLAVNPETGQLTKLHRASTLPPSYTGKNACADIHLSKDARFLYASNRGHNSIAVFALGKAGELELLTTESVRGDWPRNFTLSPDGRFLLVANQRSGNVAVFGVDGERGGLTFGGQVVEIGMAVFLGF